MKIALVKDGQVVNVIVCDMENCSVYEEDHDHVVNVTNTFVGIDWTYDGSQFIAPPVEEE